ncbi:FAD/NAD(P)-binding domain-containing protein [Hesseltinella vesiculosa]|uniref:FAD/NAD(P)-binding domain-containing protein n=1 Tax=Hesseltinella vesiculosa TaxID=101127 RepID=A0A1X2GX31_9FUNG|nr:FAD/NAD(P)-binding domain-containing protein [Hesseltinella vesiculosa]
MIMSKMNDILTSPPLLSAFESYLESVQAQENLLFLLALSNLKCVIDTEEEVNRIFKTFVVTGAPMEINITCRQDIERQLLSRRSGRLTLAAATRIYAKAETEIRDLLEIKVSEFRRATSLNSLKQSEPEHNQKRVVIVGGGFVGFTVAAILDPMPRFHVTLIDTKDSFEYTPGMVKMLVRPEETTSLRVRHDAYVKNGSVVVGYAQRIREDGKAVEVNNKMIELDYLVIGTGSTYRSKIKSFDVSALYRMSQLSTEYNELKMAKSVLIIGGGLVGCELASEIALHEFPDEPKKKKVTVIESHDCLVYRSSPSQQRKALEYLNEIGVTVILNERMIDFDGYESKTYLGISGNMYPNFDKVYLATGTAPCSQIIRQSNMPDILEERVDVRDRIKVKRTLQLDHPEFDHIFAGGDVTNIKEEKTGYSATLAGVCIARNICRMEKGKAPLQQGEKGTLPAPLNPLHGNKDHGGIGRQPLPEWKRSLSFLYPSWAKLKYFDETEFLQIVAGEASGAVQASHAIGRLPKPLDTDLSPISPQGQQTLCRCSSIQQHCRCPMTKSPSPSGSTVRRPKLYDLDIPPASNMSGKDVLITSANTITSLDEAISLQSSGHYEESLLHSVASDTSIHSRYTTAVNY